MPGTQSSARYAIARTTKLPFSEVDRRVREHLQEEGFGVLTEIDVRATMQKKLGVEIAPYTIMGACNPALALQAISAEPDVGLLLPCNVVIRELPEGGTLVEALDPVVQLEVAGNERLKTLSGQVRERLERVVKRVVAD